MPIKLIRSTLECPRRRQGNFAFKGLTFCYFVAPIEILYASLMKICRLQSSIQIPPHVDNWFEGWITLISKSSKKLTRILVWQQR